MTEAKKVSVHDAVIIYNALRSVNAAKLPDAAKSDIIAIIRATRAFKTVAEAQVEYEKDVAERLKPSDFDVLMEKRSNFESLSADEKTEVANRLMAYEKSFLDCIKPEQDKMVEIGPFEPLSDGALSGIATASENITVETLLMIADFCCK